MFTLAAVVAGLLGVLTAVIGFWGVVEPRSVQASIRTLPTQSWFALAITTRTIFGASLLLAAADSRFPVALSALGALALLAAITFVFAGPERLRSLVRWWEERSAGVIRVWSLFAAAFGAFIVYALL